MLFLFSEGLLNPLLVNPPIGWMVPSRRIHKVRCNLGQAILGPYSPPPNTCSSKPECPRYLTCGFKGVDFYASPNPGACGRDAGREGSRGREERQPGKLGGGVLDQTISSKLMKDLWGGNVTADITFVSSTSVKVCVMQPFTSVHRELTMTGNACFTPPCMLETEIKALLDGPRTPHSLFYIYYLIKPTADSPCFIIIPSRKVEKPRIREAKSLAQ